MTKDPKIPWWLLISLFIGLAIALFGWLNVVGLRAEEPRRALVSIEMMKDGNFVIPHMFGWVYYNKPPFFNWVMVLFFKLFGSYAPWVVRLPSLISLVFLAVINYRFITKFLNRQTALLSSLILLTGGEILFYGSVNAGEIDLFLTLLVYLQAVLFFSFYSKGKYLQAFIWSYFFTGLGFLTKGLPSIAFQGLTVLFTLIWFKNFKLLFNWRHFTGLAVLAAIIAGYIALLASENVSDGFLIRQFKEASQRTGLETGIGSTLKNIYNFPMQIALDLMPWTLLILFLFTHIKDKSKTPSIIQFSLLFIIVNIPLYWFTGDFKVRYVYPFFPFLAIALSYIFDKGKEEATLARKVFEIIIGIAIFAVAIALISSFFIPQAKEIGANQFTSVLLILASGLIIFGYFKMKHLRIYFLMAILIVARIGMNNIYFTALEKDSRSAYYESVVDKMLTITNGEKIYFAGKPHTYPSSYSLGPFHIETEKLETAPVIAFQIPYYYTLKTDEILYFKRELLTGNFYLINKKYLRLYRSEILYEFNDPSVNNTKWALVRSSIDLND